MKYLSLLLVALVTLPALAQDVSKMNPAGQSGPSEKSRYVLGLVKNGYADRLNKYFEKEPWQIQTEIDTYTDTNKTASIGIFCVAVDLGELEVVKSFVENGIGPADLCRVQTFSTQKVVVSRAEALINTDTTHKVEDSTSSSRSQAPVRSVAATWFGVAYYSNKGGTSSETSTHSETTTTNTTEKYTKIHYGEKKVVKTYFANPLDFATGEVFDYLWEKGFRSPNLFTKQALADAKANGRTEVWQYIMDNKPQSLGDKPTYISQGTYDKLLETAKKDPNSLAYTLLEKNVLGQVSTSAQLTMAQQAVQRELQDALVMGNDTTGYGAVTQDLATRLDQTRVQEQNHAKHVAFCRQVKNKIKKENGSVHIDGINSFPLYKSGRHGDYSATGEDFLYSVKVYAYGNNTVQIVYSKIKARFWRYGRGGDIEYNKPHDDGGVVSNDVYVNGKKVSGRQKGEKTLVYQAEGSF